MIQEYFLSSEAIFFSLTQSGLLCSWSQIERFTLSQFSATINLSFQSGLLLSVSAGAFSYCVSLKSQRIVSMSFTCVSVSEERFALSQFYLARFKNTA